MNMTILCFFFNDTATTEIYTLSLHDALPIFKPRLLSEQVYESAAVDVKKLSEIIAFFVIDHTCCVYLRSEEHTSELQSRQYLVCRLLLEKKKTIHYLRHQLSLHILTIDVTNT